MTARQPIVIIEDEDDENNAPLPRPQSPHAPLSFDEIHDTMQYAQSRHPGVSIFNQHQLTVHELHALTRLLRSLEQHNGIPVTMRDFRRMLEKAFNGWNTNCPIANPPVLPVRKFADSRILVGSLTQDHPLTTETARNGNRVPAARRACQPVFLGVDLQYEDGTVDWAWRDQDDAVVSPRYVRLDNGKTATSIRADAMVRFDREECLRIQTYNSALIDISVRTIVKKFADVGTALYPDIDEEDRPRGFATAQLARPIAQAQAARMVEAVEAAHNRMPTLPSPYW
ncbi:hypothetical protein LB507_005003 [Fusarium sp. FIESC RH6]|nr:hypothetical protein LB507_005003 [Fusarium sp. FIESC RH6]